MEAKSNHTFVEDRSDLNEDQNVYIKNVINTQNKLKSFVADGPSNLQIISDFDYTLTKFWLNGRKGASTHGIMEACNLLTDEYHKKAKALAAEYYPMEVDPDLPYDEKYIKMVEWWTKAHEALLEGGLTIDKVKEAVAGANIRLRDGCQDLFSKVESENIPMLIFSAGLADVIEEVLQQRLNQPVPSHVHVVSNHMSFDEQGALSGFQDPLFHVFNKNASAILHLPFFSSEHIQSRKNVLLLGDGPGDANMAAGLEDVQVLRIGYLNDKVEERLEDYQDRFDIVITGDGNLLLVLDLLTDILSQEKNSKFHLITQQFGSSKEKEESKENKEQSV